MVVAAEIKHNAYYDEKGVSKLLSLSIDRIREECNRERLRCTKRAGRRFFRGQWLIDWLENIESSAMQDGGNE